LDAYLVHLGLANNLVSFISKTQDIVEHHQRFHKLPCFEFDMKFIS